MKKTIIAMAIIATTLTACSEPVKAEVFGSVEKKWDNGTEAISSEDTYLGYSIYEDLGNGLYAQGEISMDLSSTATERKTFIGLANSIAAISVGKQGSVQGDLGNNTIDIFEGPGFDVNNSADIDNSIIGSVNISGLKILGSNIPISAENDSYEVGAKLNIGPVALGGVYAETAANVTNKLVGATITYNGVDIGGVFEIEKDAAGTETNTVTTVSTISSGTNDIKAGFQDVENISETYTLEGVHNFSSKTSAYVNYQKSETDVGVKNDTTTVGMRVQF